MKRGISITVTLNGRFVKPNRLADAVLTPIKDGTVVTGMEVRSSEWQVKGIRLTYPDGSQAPILGQTDSLNLWGSTVRGKNRPPEDNGYG